MVTFEINFNKPNKKYKQGDIITCKIKIRVNEIFQANSLWIRFKGAANTEFMAKRINLIPWQKKSAEETFTGEKVYFEHEKYLERFGTRDFVDEGEYEYSLSYTLPRHLPQTYSDLYGNIRYLATIVYETQSGMDKTYSEEFFIVPEFKINNHSELLEPVRIVYTHEFGFCKCDIEPHTIYMINMLPKSGYEPGETIIFTAELNNDSLTDIKGIKLRLREKLTYLAKNPTTSSKICIKTISEQKFEKGVKSHEDKIFQTTFFIDPNYEWKHFGEYGIIKSEYFVEMKAYPKGIHFKPKHKTEIMIGTVSSANTQEADTEVVSPVINFSIQNLNRRELPLPSYEDVTTHRPGFL